jgi:N-acetyl-anhydromuramyl-L-alanine amidase AmpD
MSMYDTQTSYASRMCDLDGTIYQALDLKERAWQATTSNTNSVGCEIANIGAYDPTGPTPFAQWYATDASGNTIITIPSVYGDGGIHTPGFIGSPSRPGPIAGNIQGQDLIQYDYTPQQYAALSRLIAAFCTIFPAIPCTYPTDAQGNLIPQKLPDAELATYTGLLGHFHIQTNKVDPGPAMQWDRLLLGAQSAMNEAKLAKAAAKIGGGVDQAQCKEWNLMRKMERKLINAAEETAARQRSDDMFYMVDGAWWTALQAWLHCTDGSVKRPAAVANNLLLEADERTPRKGLVLGQQYKTVHRAVWMELVELYGAATPIVRATTSIYGSKDSKPVVAASSPPAYVPVSSSSVVDASPAASSSSNSSFVVPAVTMLSDDPWIVVSKRVTGAPGGAAAL